MEPAIKRTDQPPTVSTTKELKHHEKKALLELRAQLEEAILTHRLLHEKSGTRVAMDSQTKEDPASISLWDVPLLPSMGHEGTNVLLLKFLQAREFRVADALEMLQKTLQWRMEYRIDGILHEELQMARCNTHCMDKEGHLVCYNNYGAFMRDQDLYSKTLGSDERRERFLRWQVQCLERDIKKLSFKPGGVSSMVQITDLNHSLGPGMKELRSTVKRMVSLFQDNYPEFVAKNIFINVSLRHYACNTLFSPLFTQGARSKFIFARPSKVTETLLKFIAPENILVEHGGLKREDDQEFSAEDGGVSEKVVKGGCATTIVIPSTEPGVTVVWDLTVVGWEVSYKEEFIPVDEGSYRVLIRKERNLEESIRNSFYINEPGKVVLTIDNRTLRKKRILYRSTSKPTVPLYSLLGQTHHRVV